MSSNSPPSSPQNPPTSRERLKEAAEQVVAALQSPNGNSRGDIAVGMDRLLGRWLDRYFIRHGVPEAQAEELTMDVWVNLLKGKREMPDNAFAFVCNAARNVLVDHIRHQNTAKNRAGGIAGAAKAEIFLDDELWDLVNESTAGAHADLELRDCIQKKMHHFSLTHPARAQLIEYLYQGLSYMEIATLVFGDFLERETAKVVARVRNRIEEARKQARALFEECAD